MPRSKRTLLALAAGVAIAIILVKCRVSSEDGAAPAQTLRPLSSPATSSSRAPIHGGGAVMMQSSIAGAIRDEAGAPITGALVCARGSSAALSGEAIRDPSCANSDASGAYRIGPLPAASFEVAASARSYRAAQWMRDGRRWLDVQVGEARGDVDLVLARGGVELTGTVREAGGDPLPRAHVRIGVNGMFAIDADEHGRYSAWVNPGMVTVLAVADGYATGERRGRAPGTVDIALLPESSYGGTVVDAATGEPVAGVRVSVRGAAPNEHATPEAEVAITDERGRFRIGRLEPGYYMAVARSPHGVGRSPSTVELGLGLSIDDIVLPLYPGHQVSGKIALPDGAPCRDASLSLRDAARDRYAESDQDLDGTVHLDGVLPGTYAVTVWCPEHVAQKYPPIVVGDRDVTGVVWPVSTGSVLTGRITTSAGKPVANGSITASGVRTGPRDVPPAGYATTDAHGAFTLRGVPAGRYLVAAWAARTSTRTADVELELGATPTQRDFVVDDVIGDLAGRVTRADGSAVHAAVVTARRTDGTVSVTADDGGHFMLDAIAPGDYTVSVAVRGVPVPLAGGAADVPVTVRVDAISDVQLVVANATHELHGRVVDARGAPVTDAQISVGRELGGSALTRDDEPALLVAADGTFVVTGLDDGEYTIRATRPTGTTAIAKHVPAGGSATLQMPVTGAIVGTARSPLPIDDLDIIVTTGTDHNGAREEHLYHRSTFAFRDLDAGHYTLAFLASNAMRIVDVDLAAGETLTLDIEIPATVTLVGRVVHARTGAPVAGVSVRASIHDLSYIADSQDMVHVSDDTGRFTIQRVPRGNLVIAGTMYTDGSTSGLVGTLARDAGGAVGPVLDLGDFAITPP